MGGNGTVFLKNLSESGGTLIIDGQGVASSYSTLPIPPGYIFDNIIIRNVARVVADEPLIVSNSIQILTGSIVTHSRGNTNGLQIRAARLEVDATSALDVTAKGYLGGRQSGNGWDEGRTLHEARGSTYRSGGSYGGLGANFESGNAGLTYGHPSNPVYLGSGGSRGYYASDEGGNGGGRIDIQANSAVVVDGVIRANGGLGKANQAGDGSGGSIKIQTSLIRGQGIIEANGGAYQVGGGGGRVAIEYAFLGATSDNLGDLRQITAFGGHGSNAKGGAGTVWLKRSDQSYGDLYIDDSYTDQTASRWTPLTHIGFGSILSISNDTMITDGEVTYLEGGLVGLKLNPNLEQGHLFTIIGNTTTSITVDVSGGSVLTDVASAGDTYAAVYTFDNVIFRRGGFMVLGDQLVVEDTLTLDEYSRMTHYDATLTFESRMDLVVDQLTIASNSSINVNGRGYLGGRHSPNSSDYGRTLDNAFGSAMRSGGSYGGIGAYYDGSPGDSYGSIVEPQHLGSGGSRGYHSSDRGGDGAGRISIVAKHVEVDGVISSDGEHGSSNQAGDGSGGSIFIQTESLHGSGIIRANGGYDQVAGGGGRIAILYDTMTLEESHLEALGGQGSNVDGGNGTVYLKQTAQTYGDLIIDGHGFVTPWDTCFIPGGYTFDHIIFRNNARVTADDGLTAEDSIELLSHSRLTHTAHHEDGLYITAANMLIDSNSAVDVTARGYRGARTTGNNVDTGQTLGGLPGSTQRSGGSYGGRGASYDGTSGAVYGHPASPIYLGSGGSRGYYASDEGGHGGGRVTLTITDTLQVNGAIRSHGGTGAGNQAGDGSGGSIHIDTSTLRGSGMISADGGAYHVGGGGGRVAIVYDTLGTPGDDLNGVRNVTAFGGLGGNSKGSAGTVFMRQRSQALGDLYIDGGVTNGPAAAWTPLTPICFGRSQSMTNLSLITDGKVRMIPNGLVGLEINPNTGQDHTFIIAANTESSIVVTVEGGTNLTDVAVTGDEYVGVYRFDNVIIRRGGRLLLGDALWVADQLHVSEYGQITHYDTTATFDSRLLMTVGELIVDSNATIYATGKGYPGGRSSGNNVDEGQWLDHASGSTYRSGGSYGGLGSVFNSGVPNPVYGSETYPAALGAGGSRGYYSSNAGGDGGGWIAIYAALMTVNGVISSDGGSGGGNQAGDGSGGTVYIETGAIQGHGTIRANGGAYQVGGGGGRVAIHYPGASSDTNGLFVVSAGGVGSNRTGADGTVHVNPAYVWGGASGPVFTGTRSLMLLASPLKILRITSDNDGSVIEWNLDSNEELNDRRGGEVELFWIEYCPDLKAGEWETISEPLSGNSWSGKIPMKQNSGFIRMRTGTAEGN